MSSAETPLLRSSRYGLPRGTILELGPSHHDPNAPNIKHTLEQSLYLPGAHEHMYRTIISVGHASPAAEAAALAGAAETARLATARFADPTAWRQRALHRFEADLYNLDTRQRNEMQRRMQDQHGYTEFRGCNEGEFDLCAFENPQTGDVRAFKRPFIPIGGEDPFLVSRELTAASHAPIIARSRILHPGVLQQHPLMSRAMLSAMDANPERTRRSGLAGLLSAQFVVPPPSRIYADKKKQLEQQAAILKKPRGGKTRTGRSRLRSRSRRR
jgi:hypothetical protein